MLAQGGVAFGNRKIQRGVLGVTQRVLKLQDCRCVVSLCLECRPGNQVPQSLLTRRGSPRSPPGLRLFGHLRLPDEHPIRSSANTIGLRSSLFLCHPLYAQHSLSCQEKNIVFHPVNNKPAAQCGVHCDKALAFCLSYRRFTIVIRNTCLSSSTLRLPGIGNSTESSSLAWKTSPHRDICDSIPCRTRTWKTTLERLRHGDLHFLAFMDRASDTDGDSSPSPGSVREKNILHINPVEMMKRASDKATMHLEFLTHGIDVPFTIIISPYNKKQEVELSLSDLAQLGRPVHHQAGKHDGRRRRGHPRRRNAERRHRLPAASQERQVPAAGEDQTRRRWTATRHGSGSFPYSTGFSPAGGIPTHFYHPYMAGRCGRIALKAWSMRHGESGKYANSTFFSTEIAITAGEEVRRCRLRERNLRYAAPIPTS